MEGKPRGRSSATSAAVEDEFGATTHIPSISGRSLRVPTPRQQVGRQTGDRLANGLQAKAARADSTAEAKAGRARLGPPIRDA
ncbi:hypothetical protein AXG93_3348s1190 [Marchantia polymorpha subsp. ruderalis]|uniref:Uncharacterized protein n=1 Tax=Marchantia polymorpha subsp. ruderalis TaxID=1480154 RepID=A0A176VQ86_MARPO|nr:hypothetical protein AXG93_3348s1190 [Marchantia polymorpha subsp. ruderalis]